MAAKGVVVWEWQNEFGCWLPYDAKTATFIESNKYSSSPVDLGGFDPKLYLYYLDLIGMFQVRHGTGTQREIRRTVYPADSPIAKGITWQWQGDIGTRWFDFNLEVATYLEDCYTKKQTLVDLTKTTFMLPYHIDLVAMTQMRVETGRKRKIQRVFTSASYPVATMSSDTSQTATSSTSHASSKRKSGTNHFLGKRRKSATATSSTASLPGSSSSHPRAVILPAPSSTTASVIQANTSAFATIGAPLSHTSGTSAPTSTSSTSSLTSHNGPLTFPSIQGPVTRNKYNQAISALSQLSGSSSQVSGSNLPPPPNYSALLNATGSTTHTSVPQAPAGVSSTANFTLLGNPLTSSHGPLFLNPAGNPGFAGSSGLNVTGASGSAPGFVSGSQFQPGSLPWPSSSAFQPYQQMGHFNPSHLLPRPKGSRIRPAVPAQQSSSGSSTTHNGPSITIPSHARIPNNVPKGNKGAIAHTADDILHNYVTTIFTPPADEDCCICYEKLIEASGQGRGTAEDGMVIQLEKCSHMFHKLCLGAMYESGSKDGSIQCPTCKTIYGQKLGNCPRGEMEYHILNTSLAGYEDSQTIQIAYHIHNGTQGAGHPFPGRRFTTRGFPRIGYVPDNDKGRKVLQLLILAWQRRLIFTIGTSSTTGEDGTVVWNEIHHKTELGTNYSGHGYPDPKYLDNVLMELSVHGITEKDLQPS